MEIQGPKEKNWDKHIAALIERVKDLAEEYEIPFICYAELDPDTDGGLVCVGGIRNGELGTTKMRLLIDIMCLGVPDELLDTPNERNQDGSIKFDD